MAKPLSTKVAAELWKNDAIVGARAQIAPIRTSPAASSMDRAVRDASSIRSLRYVRASADAQLVDRRQHVVGEGGDGQNPEFRSVPAPWPAPAARRSAWPLRPRSQPTATGLRARPGCDGLACSWESGR